MSDSAQTIVTQKGDKLIDLVKRVYGIREPDRALAVATAVSTATAKNRAVVASRFGVALEAGLQIEFPPWNDVVQLMKSQDVRRAQLERTGSASGNHRLLNNPIAPMRQVAIGKQGAMPVGERSLPNEMAKALGLSAQAAVEELRPLGEDDADPSRTQSAGATRMGAFGRKLAKELTRASIAELLALSDKGLDQAFAMMLQKLNPRSFMPSVDVGPTLAMLVSGFFPALAERILGEAKGELERRRKLLERGFLRIKTADLKLPQGPVSKAFAGDAKAAYDAAHQAVAAGPLSVWSPRILEQIKQQYSVSGSPHEAKVFLPPRAAGLPPLAAFLDSFAPGGDDGPLAERLFDVVTRVSDTHRNAVALATALTANINVDGNEGPNAALAKHLPSLLKSMRETRAQKSAEEQTRMLADERHLLSGRNFVSFRKDVLLALDKRLTLAVHLSSHQRMTILLALLMQDGHRLPTMRLEEMDAACERLMQAM